MLIISGMQMNGNVLGLAVPPFPGYGVSGKVPGRYAHLVALKMSVRDKAWQLWQTAPGVVTHQTHARALKALAARNAQIGSSRGANNSAPSAGSSNGNISAGSSGNARNDALQPNAKVRREGMNIKLTTTTTPGNNASSTAAATSTASVKSTTAAATITSNGAGPSQQPAPSSSTEAGTDSAGGGPDNEASLMSTEPSQELLESAEVENPGNEETAVGEGNGNSNEDGGAMDLDTTESTQEISSSSSTVAVLQSSADSPAPVPGDSSSSSSSSVLGKKVKTQFVLGGAAAAKKRRVLLNPPSSGCFLMDTYIDES